ncbi:MAG: hypothetical protein KAJ58_00360 [Candidatus Pacebacteria bacterium]|nr:hypothetical protein [Candidatus Paceibacterota bacterium]
MQNENIKKIIITVTIILLIVGIFSYFIFFNKENNNDQSSDNIGSFPVDEVQNISLGNDWGNLGNNPDYLNNQDPNNPIPILRKISDNPVAGAIIFKQTIEKDDFYTIRYMEKMTGHIYETKTNSLTLERISNKTIPKINTTTWLDENTLFFNYLDNDVIKTYSATLTSNATSTNMDLDGVYLQDNIQNITYINDDLFYLVDSGSNSDVILTDIENTKPKQLFTSPLREWGIDNIDDRRIAFTTKSTENILGYLFIYDSITKKFSKILGKRTNLSTLLNEDLDILYSQNTKLGLTLSLYDFESETNTDLPIRTFPEKCVWGKDTPNLYCGIPSQKIYNYSLENWYKGNILFSDEIWSINTETNKPIKIVSLTDSEGWGIDATQLQITDKDDYLIFINKKDFSLWGLQVFSGTLAGE